MTVSLLVNNKGDVVVWTEPRIRRIEPSKDAKQIILGLLADEGDERF